MTHQDPDGVSSSRLSNLAAAAIVEAFDGYQDAFDGITRRAPGRFDRRDWKGAVADAAERLDLYSIAIDRLERTVRDTLGTRVADSRIWAGTKAVYSGLIAGRQDWELAETFFNSVTRRVFATEGVDPGIEFVDSDFEAPSSESADPLCKTYLEPDTPALIDAVLRACPFTTPYADLRDDARLVAERLSDELRVRGITEPIDRAEILRVPFFRRKGAYLLGRVFSGSRATPLALALLHGERGIAVDAVLTDEDDISILFSFAQSHFHVDLGPPHKLARYLKALLPKKPIAELYIALGRHKHGKTELYRDLLRHLDNSDERFAAARGIPGTVMLVFTMPGHDVVLKAIRDRFPAIKPLTAGVVRDKYRLVFRHDRAGRLVEAQEYEHLRFERARFTPELLKEFQRDADRNVVFAGDTVVIHHAYLERRVTPLNLYVEEAPDADARRAIVDFGQAIKDLASNGIFPGELLPKNFGVTRHGRVVCYDYDELSLLTDFDFRPLPVAQIDEDEYADEAWFGVGPRDVFPEEMRRFLGLPDHLAAELERSHGDLYDWRFWNQIQSRVKSGEIIDVLPYSASRRLRQDPPSVGLI